MQCDLWSCVYGMCDMCDVKNEDSVAPKTIPKFAVHEGIEEGELKAPMSNSDLIAAWNQRSKSGNPIESFSPLDEDATAITVFEDCNLFAKMIHDAFYGHYGIKFNPNVVWLVIAQGFSHYVNINADVLRTKFVSFNGRQTLHVNRPGFFKARPSNDWAGVFADFGDQISQNTSPELLRLIECNFSNTTLNDTVASHISLMETVSHYFEYEMGCGCGIPFIELLGTVEDWELVRLKAAQLSEYIPSDELANTALLISDDRNVKSTRFENSGKKRGSSDPRVLQNWLTELLPVLDNFVAAAHGTLNLGFWRSTCNIHGASGIQTPMTGWINAFFPYLNGNRSNTKMGVWRECENLKPLLNDYAPWIELEDDQVSLIAGGINLKDFPVSLSSAKCKVTWNQGMPNEEEEMLLFQSGLTAIYQHPDGMLECRAGWAVIR